MTAEEEALSLLTDQFVPGRKIRERMTQCKRVVKFYSLLAKLEDHGKVEHIVRPKAIDGGNVKEHCYRRKQ